MSSRSQHRRIRQKEQGYILLTLLLMMAVMGIVAATMVTSIKFDIQRDREEEMIHRGVQYSRAIRAYYKKFGRYPASIENLENTNQMRFLRKRYKDPITGNDFRLLHFGEIRMGMMGMVGGGTIPGANTIGSNGSLVPSSSSTFGNSTPNALGQNTQTASKPESDSSQNSDADSGNNQSNSSTDQNSARTLGGMPIVGVASTSRKDTIREFDKKKKYNEWRFVYDPAIDRGLLITTPYQPQMQMFGQAPPNLNGPPPTPGMGTSAPGTTANPGTTNAPNTPAPPPPSAPTDAPIQQ